MAGLFADEKNNVEHLRTGVRTLSNLVEARNVGSHRPKLSDSFDFVSDISIINPSIIKDLYEKQGLSSREIAEKFGISKNYALILLRKYKAALTPKQGRNPDNYTFPIAPYGYKIVRKKLVPHQTELKLVKLIIQLHKKESLQWRHIAEELNKRGFRTRNNAIWRHQKVKAIYQKWNSKI